MRILYVGDSSPLETSRHRAEAIRRLGHDITIWDARKISLGLSPHPLLCSISCRSGYIFLQNWILGRILKKVATLNERKFDVVWVNGGEWFGPEATKALSLLGEKLVLYNNDDPPGSRDRGRWFSLRRSLDQYDLCAVVRDVNIEEFRILGARRVERVWMSYDEEVHRPVSSAGLTNDVPESDVVFIGTWMPERGPFLCRLLDLGIPLKIFGARWEKAPEWQRLQSSWQSGPVKNRDYVRAVTKSKICLGLLSKGNRDLHTRRSLEIPYIGSVLCGERTIEHTRLFRDGVDAVFWDSPDECAALCKDLLTDDSKRERIRLSGMSRVRELNVGNEDICKQILQALKDE